MKRALGRLMMVMMVGTFSWAAGVPNEITYQGTIKEQGLPVTGDRSMLFRLTNVDGSVEYWNSGPQTITVSQGIFSSVLKISGVNWQAISPYMELSVGPKGQTPAVLLPREPISSTAYSLISGTVVDGSIGTASIAPGFGLVPSGTIIAFAGAGVPFGWLKCDGATLAPNSYPTLFAAIKNTWGGNGVSTFNLPDLQGRTVIGEGLGAGLTNRTLGDTTIGKETHQLSVSEMPSHNHAASVSDPGHRHSIPDPPPGEYGLMRRSMPGETNTTSAADATGSGDQADLVDRPLGVFTTAEVTSISVTVGNTGGNQLFSILPPSAVVSYLIKI